VFNENGRSACKTVFSTGTAFAVLVANQRDAV
jgi:hypothetical protein